MLWAAVASLMLFRTGRILSLLETGWVRDRQIVHRGNMRDAVLLLLTTTMAVLSAQATWRAIFQTVPERRL